MDIKPQSKLKFLGVEFPVVDFNSDKTSKRNENVEIKIKPLAVFSKKKPKCFKIIQEVTVFSEGVFNLKVVAIGKFEIESVEESEKKVFINANAPAIMFPYIRAFIATLTSNLGEIIGTLTIPPHFFKGEIPILEE